MKFVDLEFENLESSKDSHDRFLSIERSGKYLMSQNVEELEKVFSADQNSKNCVLVKNATDALAMVFMHLNAKNRTIIVPQFGAYPTVMAALQSGAKEIIACAVNDSLTMDINSVDIPRGSIIVPVNLYGNHCNMKEIKDASRSAGDCTIVEDCAQSTGIQSSFLSDYMIHSFYPTKPMGCRGDGGAILTNDDESSKLLRMSRFYGLNSEGSIETWGINSRIDEWQSSFLISKVKHYRSLNETRKKNAASYAKNAGNSNITYSKDCVYHQYVELYENRDAVRSIFDNLKIPTMIHYPKMLVDMPYLKDKVKFAKCKRVSDHVLSLPVGPHLSKDDIDRVIEAMVTVSNRRISFEEIV